MLNALLTIKLERTRGCQEKTLKEACRRSPSFTQEGGRGCEARGPKGKGVRRVCVVDIGNAKKENSNRGGKRENKVTSRKTLSGNSCTSL